MQHLTRFLIVAWLTLGSAFAFFDNHSATTETRAGTRVDWIASTELPREARATLALIKAGGPFRHARDGIVFGNYEKRLPRQPRGYYREYTVRTPGQRDRGPRRIVTGEGREYYYTDDHYRSFRRIRETASDD